MLYTFVIGDFIGIEHMIVVLWSNAYNMYFLLSVLELIEKYKLLIFDVESNNSSLLI